MKYITAAFAALLPFALSAQTYTNEVADIINDNCVVCHRAGGIGPMSFETYEQVRPWAPLIQMRVANREMPPYAYDHGIGIQDLQGDWRLSQDEKDTVVAWVNTGAQYGDPDKVVQPANLPDPEAWNFEGDFGQPNLIIPSVAIDIPANGNDLWHKHLVPTGLTKTVVLKRYKLNHEVTPSQWCITLTHLLLHQKAVKVCSLNTLWESGERLYQKEFVVQSQQTQK